VKTNRKDENFWEYGLNAAMCTVVCIKTKKEHITLADARNAYVPSELQ
jgi:hypothetical protein